MSPRRFSAVWNGGEEPLSAEAKVTLLRHLRSMADKRRQRYEAQGKSCEVEVEELYIARIDAEILRLKEAG
jgi:hypothetical protein